MANVYLIFFFLWYCMRIHDLECCSHSFPTWNNLKMCKGLWDSEGREPPSWHGRKAELQITSSSHIAVTNQQQTSFHCLQQLCQFSLYWLLTSRYAIWMTWMKQPQCLFSPLSVTQNVMNAKTKIKEIVHGSIYDVSGIVVPGN